jgi:hypothetical protein
VARARAHTKLHLVSDLEQTLRPLATLPQVSPAQEAEASELQVHRSV